MIAIQISYEEVIEKYADLVYRLALSHTRHAQDAEDIFQDVFLSLLKNADRLLNEEHLKYWLIRATVNRCKNHHLCFWKRRVLLDSDTLCAQVQEKTEANEVSDEVRSLIRTLPPKLKTVVYLHYYEEYSVDEIARILNIPPGTVKSRLFSARRLLKDKLKEVIDYEFS